MNKLYGKDKDGNKVECNYYAADRLLRCDNTQIAELPPLPDSLKRLDCYNTQITELPPLPNSLEWLYCENIQITKLPPLPNSLKWLYCHSTQITELPPLPKALERLDCYNTQIAELPPLPDSLRWLDCYNTQITELPPLPDSLKWLDCHNTQIIELPPLLDSLKWLYCHNTKIKTITWRGKTSPWRYADGWTMLVDRSKTIGNVQVHKARYFGSNKPCYLAEHNGIYAHGNTIKQAIEDLRCKLEPNKERQKHIDAVRKSGYVTRKQYHHITRACNAGIDEFCERNGIKDNRLSIKRVLKIAEGEYGYEAFKEATEGATRCRITEQA